MERAKGMIAHHPRTVGMSDRTKDDPAGRVVGLTPPELNLPGVSANQAGDRIDGVPFGRRLIRWFRQTRVPREKR